MHIYKKRIMGAACVGLITLGVVLGSWLGRGVSGSGLAVYVATHGSDSSGDGTEQRPFLTLSKAAQTAVPGTTIFVRGGVYEATKEEIRAQGTASEPIVIQPYPGETAVFDGTGANIGDAESIIKISNSSYVVFEGFEV
ncbi:MAG: DUF1565 domain-containing protein, partial [Anaerolineales bacterium]|nr:DUF1565 domain-containing protein [Anaerolineales bacterium]